MTTELDYRQSVDGDDVHQAHCRSCGWCGPERHASDYDDADGLGVQFAEQFADADTAWHEFYGCETVTTAKKIRSSRIR